MDEVTALRRRRSVGASATHPRRVMDAVYTAGSLAVSPDEVLMRVVVAQLHALGLLRVEEVLPDGRLRPLSRATMPTARLRPWRVSRPALGGAEAGMPDGVGLARAARRVGMIA